MGQKALKDNRRALRRTARKEKNNIVSQYMTENWDKVLVSSVAIIRRFNFKNRFKIAMTIIFRPIKKTKEKAPEIMAVSLPAGAGKTNIGKDTPPQPETSGAAAQG